MMSNRKRKRPAPKNAKPSLAVVRKLLPSLALVCETPANHLAKLDIAALNLLCASELPHAEKLNYQKLANWLDEAARRVDFETRRHWYRFLESPATYNNSPGYFCCYFLLQVLQEDFGVKYNPARVRDPSFQDPKCLEPDFRDSRDLFIHGIIDGPGGTCASMPVLYVAIGRRLLYPLKLVESRGHLFFRWDDPSGLRLGVSERFNIEGTGLGIGSYPDEHYRTWPEPWSPAEEAAGCYLKSLSPTEELAAFLCTRGECLTDNERIPEAIQAYRWACVLMPNDARYRNQLNRLLSRCSPTPEQIYQHITAVNRQNQARREQLLTLATRQQRPPVAPHGGYCQCNQCQQARRSAQRPQAPGHLPGCPCPFCQPHSPFGSSRSPFNPLGPR